MRAAILEVFGKNEPLDNAEIKIKLGAELKQIDEIYHLTTWPDIMIEYEYLVKIGYFKFTDNEKKITLSEIGIKALRECVWENLASSAFFGYRSLVLSRLTVSIASVSLLVALVSIVLTLFALAK